MAVSSHISLSSTDPKASVPEDRDTITSPVYCKLLRCIKRDIDLTVIHLAGCGLHISYSDLEKATKSFSEENLIGKGGFGRVYRGYMRSTTVAIKVLSEVINIIMFPMLYVSVYFIYILYVACRGS